MLPSASLESALLTLALLASLAAAVAGKAGVRTAILYSTIYNYTTPGGIDPNFVKKQVINLPLIPGSPLDQSHNSTGPDDLDIVGVEILDSRELQPFEGTLCGITDAASISLQDLKGYEPGLYTDIMKLLFSTDEGFVANSGGLGLSFTRSPLGASDFGKTIYSYDDTADCSADTSLSQFTIEKAPKMWATHIDAHALNPNLKTAWTPWSPPAWMKSTAQNCSAVGGSLDSKNEDVFAEYLARSAQDIGKKIGKNPAWLTLQNDPEALPDNSPGSKLAADASARISRTLRSKLDARGLQDVKIGANEGSYSSLRYALDSLDNKGAFDLVTWKCYDGDASNLSKLSLAYPEIPQLNVDCTRITQQLKELWPNLRENVGNMLVEGSSIANGARTAGVWNCVLQADENGFTDPSLPGKCQNCAAPILIYNARKDGNSSQTSPAPSSSKRGMEKRQSDRKPFFKLTSDFAFLAHVQRATAKPGTANASIGPTIRTGVKSTDLANMQPETARVLAQAFKTPLSDGRHRYGINILQRNDHVLSGKFDPLIVTLALQGQIVNVTLDVGLHTLVWDA